MMDHEMVEKFLPVFKTVLDEDRLRILGCLANEAQPADRLAVRLKLKLAAMQRHLALLTESGLVQAAPAEAYRLDVKGLQALKRELFALESRSTTNLTTEEKILAAFVDGERLKGLPAKSAKLVVVLRWLATKFELGQRYPEREVNEIIQRHHPDYASLRRFLVDHGFMERAKGVYWRTEENPD